MAGLGMKDIKRRIKSVNNTKQITKAMELVSSAKLRKSKENLEKSRPYFDTLYQTIKDIASESKGIKSIYLEEREKKNVCYIVIAGDRGLCGGYNSNLLKAAISHMQGEKHSIIPVGRKSVDYFSKRDYSIIEKYSGISENPSYGYGQDIAMTVIELYKKGEIDEVNLVYTFFKSPLVQEPKVVKLLPLSFEAEEMTDKEKSKVLMNYEPSEEVVLEYLIPKYVAGIIYGGLVEASTSEQGARRMAMESATDNAEEMIQKLDLLYNRARQASITQEIAEIVAGANA